MIMSLDLAVIVKITPLALSVASLILGVVYFLEVSPPESSSASDVGCDDGCDDGIVVGRSVGKEVGTLVGKLVGAIVGSEVGLADGCWREA